MEIARQTVAFVDARYLAGAVGQMDTLQAEQSLIGKINRLKDLQEQREEARNAMAILFNRPPSWRVAQAQTLPVHRWRDSAFIPLSRCPLV